MGLVASLTAQHVERAPRAPELFSRGSHHATGTFDVGNPNLGIELAQSIEFGLKRAEGPLRFDASVYHSRFSGFIYRRLTDQFCADDFASCHRTTSGHGERRLTRTWSRPWRQLQQALYTQRDANFTGAEIAAQLDVAPLGSGMFGIDGMYDIVRARFADGSVVPRLPPQRFGGGIWWRDHEWFARVGALHALAQTKIAAEETPTDSYTLLKAELSYTRQARTRRVWPAAGVHPGHRRRQSAERQHPQPCLVPQGRRVAAGPDCAGVRAHAISDPVPGDLPPPAGPDKRRPGARESRRAVAFHRCVLTGGLGRESGTREGAPVGLRA